jgi:hypothetical protein
MAWEWVAPTATAVVALGGIAATWLTARGGRESQERLQAAQRDEARKMTMRTERRQAYADFAGEVREWRIRSSLQGVFTPIVEKQASEFREAVAKILSEDKVDMTVDHALADPGVMAALARKHARSVAHIAAMPPDHALVAFGQILRLAAAIRLIGGLEVVAAVDRVQVELRESFVTMMATRRVSKENQGTLIKTLTLAENAMANELRLSD